MAERRMFTKKITESDSFLDMPASTQALYFHLNMHADDDGFVNNPRSIQRIVGASDDDARILLAKKFIISFESGIIVIKHWKMHNYIQSDRYKPTDYIDEKALLSLDNQKTYHVEASAETQCVEVSEDEETEKSKKNTRKATVFFPESPELESAFKDYMDMRKKIKAPMTERAVTLAINKLEELGSRDEAMMVAILNQSTMNSWKGLFPLKEEKTTTASGGSIVDEWMNA